MSLFWLPLQMTRCCQAWVSPSSLSESDSTSKSSSLSSFRLQLLLQPEPSFSVFSGASGSLLNRIMISSFFPYLAQTSSSQAHGLHIMWSESFTVFCKHLTHFLGFDSGLYLLYFTRHSRTSLQRWHTPSWSFALIFLVWTLLSNLSFLKVNVFWCFWGRDRVTLPFWELITKISSTVNRCSL